mgnify:CR=1 FL=1
MTMKQFGGYDLASIGVSKRPSQKDQILNAMRDMKLREDRKRYEEYLIIPRIFGFQRTGAEDC